ncbi:MAG: ComEC/Rec2 family competence protein [Christensenellaceae bacterium]|nr:ComEC/Rec2 family competence protein [Christensenellaceae bacterium]
MPFHYRPMVTACLGLCLGIAFAHILSGIWLFAAVCLFSVLGLVAWWQDMPAWRTLALWAVAGLLRPALLPAFTPPSGFMRPFLTLRFRLIDLSEKLFGAQAPLLTAMLWGDTIGLSPTVYDAYKGAGILHVLALSGLNVSFVTAALNTLFRRVKESARLALTAALLVCYCAIAAFPPSLVRASVMSLCVLFGGVSGRKGDMASGIAFAALAILLPTPEAMYDVGFQLSFAAVAVIAMLSGALQSKLPLPKPVAGTLALSVCGTLGTLPLTMYYFREVAVLSIFANILILPVVPFAFLCAMAANLAAVILPRLGEFLAPTACLLADCMVVPAQYVSSVPFALLRVKRPGLLACAAVYLALLAASRYCLWERKKQYAAAGALALLAALLYGVGL